MLRFGAERDEVGVVDDQRVHRAAATRSLLDLPYGVWHAAAQGYTWAEFGEAIFEDAGLDCRVRPDHDG